MRNTKKVIAATAAVATLVGLAACGSSSDNSANKGDADKAELVFWGWDSGNSMKEILADFEKANPGITVKFNNTGTAEKTSTALSNAIAAGNGAPDVVMLEDPTVTQFAVTEGLVDLSEFGADKLADDFAAGPWNKLQYNNKPYALPIDSGPEMFFYNKAVFDKAGVDGESIKTWDDYYEAAKKIRATGSYITNLAGTSNDYQPFTAQIWQAGAQPWKVDGENITINMTKDEGMQRYIQFVQKLIDEDLVDTKTPNWSDDWNRELNDGTLASLTIGAWMPINLMGGAPDQAGNWRVAQLPQWEEGKEVSAEDGGSALAITAQSKNQAAAYKLVEYMTYGGRSDHGRHWYLPGPEEDPPVRLLHRPDRRVPQEDQRLLRWSERQRSPFRRGSAIDREVPVPAVQPVRPERLRRRSLQGLLRRHHPGEGA